MIDLDHISTFISSTGFPVFSWCVLAYYLFNSGKKEQELLVQLKEIVEHNTTALQSLISKLNKE